MLGMRTQHPSDGELERISVGLLNRADSCRVQRHLYRCAACQGRLIAIETEGGRTHQPIVPAAEDPNAPLAFIHYTADGPFHSQSEPYLGIWRARHWGKSLYGMHICKSVSEANEYLTTSFIQMFPEHRCNERCRMAVD